MQTIAAAVAIAPPLPAVDDSAVAARPANLATQRRLNRERHAANQARYLLLEQVITVGPVGRDTVAYVRAHKPVAGQTPEDRDLQALLSVREWTSLVSDPQARFLLLQQQRRVANLLGIRQAWEEAVR